MLQVVKEAKAAGSLLPPHNPASQQVGSSL